MNHRAPSAALRLAAVLLLAAGASGCVSAGGYFTDRWRDAKDIFSVSVGTGGGAKARVGPLQAGVFLNTDVAGFRGGTGFVVHDNCWSPGSNVFDFVSPVPAADFFGAWLTSAETFAPENAWADFDPVAVERGKTYYALFPWVPFVTVANQPCYYTQIDVAVGAGGTLRVGFNPGELVDFLLGWTTLDIFGDDVEARREREAKENEGKTRDKAKGKVPPEPAPPAPGKGK